MNCVARKPKILCPENYPSKVKETLRLSDKQKVREFVTSKTDLQEMLKEVI